MKTVSPEAGLAIAAICCAFVVAYLQIGWLAKKWGWDQSRTNRIADRVVLVLLIAVPLTMYWAMPYLERLRDLMWANG